MTQYFVWDKAVAEQYVPNYADLKELADLTDGLTAIKDATNTAPFILNMQGLDAIFGAKFDGLTAGLPTLGVRYDDNSPQGCLHCGTGRHHERAEDPPLLVRGWHHQCRRRYSG